MGALGTCIKCGKKVDPNAMYRLNNREVRHFDCDHPLGYRSPIDKRIDPPAEAVEMPSDSELKDTTNPG